MVLELHLCHVVTLLVHYPQLPTWWRKWLRRALCIAAVQFSSRTTTMLLLPADILFPALLETGRQTFLCFLRKVIEAYFMISNEEYVLSHRYKKYVKKYECPPAVSGILV